MGVMARFGVSTAAQVSTYQLPNMMACMDICKHVAWTNDWHISSMCARLGSCRGLSSRDESKCQYMPTLEVTHGEPLTGGTYTHGN